MLKKTIITSAVSIGLVAITALPLLAQTTSNSSTATASPAVVSCVGSAVNTREQALDSAMSTYTQALNSAYGTRATALQQAYSQPRGNNVIKNAVKAAWSNFNTAMKNARKGWNTSRNAAWSKFKTAAKACKAPASIGDSDNASSEASGQ